MGTKRTTTVTPPVTVVDWVSTLARLEIGDKVLTHGKTQAQLGGVCAKRSKDGKRFVTRKIEDRLYIIRVS